MVLHSLPIFDRFDQAFGECLQAFGLVDQNLRTLVTLHSRDKRLRTALRSAMMSFLLLSSDISDTDNYLVLQAKRPFTWLCL